MTYHKLYACVYASQAAACMGAHRHRKTGDAMLAFWERMDPLGFREALERNAIATDEQVVSALMGRDAQILKLVDTSRTSE